MISYKLWENAPGMCCEEPVIEYYPAENRQSDAAVVILPGGGYNHRAQHEGEGYAQYINSLGIDAFVCQYRVWPHKFPLELLDARRAVRFVRYKAAELGLDPNKVALMGSSAGGHLSALTATYTDPIEYEGVDEIDDLPFVPNATILCYAVLHCPDELEIAHYPSFANLLPENADFRTVSPDFLVTKNTPPAFIWHTSGDPVVNVMNAYLYASALRKFEIPHEMHVFAKGGHGLGVAAGWDYVNQWTTLLANWFKHIGWLPEGGQTWR